MATIDDKSIILLMLQNNGSYPGDPRAAQIWGYKNDWGKNTFAVYMRYGYVDIQFSPYVHNPILLWDRRAGLTMDGKKLLEENE